MLITPIRRIIFGFVILFPTIAKLCGLSDWSWGGTIFATILEGGVVFLWAISLFSSRISEEEEEEKEKIEERI